jgi:hypothetical protein
MTAIERSLDRCCPSGPRAYINNGPDYLYTKGISPIELEMASLEPHKSIFPLSLANGNWHFLVFEKQAEEDRQSSSYTVLVAGCKTILGTNGLLELVKDLNPDVAKMKFSGSVHYQRTGRDMKLVKNMNPDNDLRNTSLLGAIYENVNSWNEQLLAEK